MPLHQGNGFVLAETGGVEESRLPSRKSPRTLTRSLLSSELANSVQSAEPCAGQIVQATSYINGPCTVATGERSRRQSIGGSQPHSNFQPYLCVDFIISLFGIFPSQT